MIKQSKNIISVIIPVYNEEERINKTINWLRAIQKGSEIEILVVDGNSSKNTLNAVEDTDIIKLSSAKGRAYQMNHGAAMANGNLLLFLHADTILPVDAFQIIDAACINGEYIGGAFTLSFDNNRFAFKLIAFMADIRNRLSRIPFGDQGIFITKDYFNKIGCYKVIPLMEDVDLMKRIKKSGGKIHISEKQIITSARKWEKEGVLYSNMRNWAIQILYYAGTPPEKLVKYYYRTGS